jgi:hypothetical protein
MAVKKSGGPRLAKKPSRADKIRAAGLIARSSFTGSLKLVRVHTDNELAELAKEQRVPKFIADEQLEAHYPGLEIRPRTIEVLWHQVTVLGLTGEEVRTLCVLDGRQLYWMEPDDLLSCMGESDDNGVVFYRPWDGIGDWDERVADLVIAQDAMVS